MSEHELDEPQLQEALYYLQSYGTPLSMLAFYRRHGCWQKAAQYVMDRVSYLHHSLYRV